ncbi:hypothetical protein MRB53_010691 [Persea americana]|uniref:Uncharacterized protein n=1 Tax=Persea americana TaxID=3435 RepID=A0ACC2LSN8_PERAE|nr:hypothetical protein MRB53_010691 [Persea americana]
MAWVICTPFSRPAVCTPATKTEQFRNHQRPKGLPLNRVSSETAARPAVRMVIFNSVISSVNRELLKPSRHPCGPDYICPIIFSTIHITISGYWVGPDIEDGWGYVEASVNQVSVC